MLFPPEHGRLLQCFPFMPDFDPSSVPMGVDEEVGGTSPQTIRAANQGCPQNRAARTPSAAIRTGARRRMDSHCIHRRVGIDICGGRLGTGRVLMSRLSEQVTAKG